MKLKVSSYGSRHHEYLLTTVNPRMSECDIRWRIAHKMSAGHLREQSKPPTTDTLSSPSKQASAFATGPKASPSYSMNPNN